ncbi:protein of unknown function [Mucilaginibacter lappiensis]|uniref:DUF4280 domain-containing protein n=1 Tax=Mucilaginibacter lappiensis TaxID=354630 RepID=A0ABR6PPS4_9SPHI|nr:PAAR-like protein [Mucilaginibacter lappiensis]MBB6111770.1 hypothetical protein [Mucilaginibacter lappiensis]SIR87327.1 protein of unknown function [Mucilaginibacter lappiensis]
MTQLYVPDKAYLVCSDGMHTQQIKVNSQSTIKIANGRLAATIKDRTGANFVCGKMVLAFAIIGVLVAAFIAAAVVLSGGTLAVGLGVMLAAGAVGGAGAGLGLAMMPCTCALLTMPHDWQPVHPKVLIEKKKALIEKSIVPCILGGNIKVLYSKEAAEAEASLNRGKTIAGVAAIASIAFIAGTAAAAAGNAFVAVKSSFLTYGFVSGMLHIGGIVGVGGASYGANSLYDWTKKKTGADGYITGEAYKEHDEDHKKLDDVVDFATDKRVGAPIDALGSAGEISEHQTSALNTTTQTTQTLSRNSVFVASSDGTLRAPGTVSATQTTTVSSNAIPSASASRIPSNLSSVQEATTIRSTPSTLEMSRINSVTEYSTQFNNKTILAGSFKAFSGKYGLGVAKGMGTNMLIDAIRAGGNWLVASDIKELMDAMANAEVASRKSITVVEDEV